MFSMAVIGMPAVTLPTIGTFTTLFFGICDCFIYSRISIARGFVGSRRISPLLSNRAK